MDYLEVSVNLKLVIRCFGITDRAVPRRFPFVHLQKEAGIKALEVATLGWTTWNLNMDFLKI